MFSLAPEYYPLHECRIRASCLRAFSDMLLTSSSQISVRTSSSQQLRLPKIHCLRQWFLHRMRQFRLRMSFCGQLWLRLAISSSLISAFSSASTFVFAAIFWFALHVNGQRILNFVVFAISSSATQPNGDPLSRVNAFKNAHRSACATQMALEI